MSETAKCPCCGAGIIKHNELLIKEPMFFCDQCYFRCNPEDLPCIIAAMEYAKATSAWFALPYSKEKTDAEVVAEHRMIAAEDNVLEVFK